MKNNGDSGETTFLFSRTFSIYRKTIGISLLVIIQSLVLIIKNIVHSNIIFLPLMYIFPFLILITCIVILSDSNKYYRILPFTNKVNQ